MFVRNKIIHINSIYNFLLAIFFATFFTGCVSVSLSGSSGPKKSDDVSLVSPQKPFKESQSVNSDRIWESKNTSNTISYYSSCSDNEPSLKSIRTNSLEGIDDFKIDKEETVQINSREGLRSTIDGKIEGVPVRLEILVFTKNSCSYQLTYAALKENYGKEIYVFNKFVSNFKVK